MKTEATVHSCMKSTSGHPIPLEGVVVEGVVYGAEARIVLKQRYRNVEKYPIEAIYTFPAPSDATVVGFVLETAGTRFEADVEEREAAFARYEEALTSGHGAALLEEERKNVFTASVGNLVPGEATLVEVTYVQKLSADEGALRLMIPTVVAPRYIPGSPQGDRSGHGVADPTDRVPDADRISPRVGQVTYSVQLDIVFDAGSAVSIESPSHAVLAREESNSKLRVSFASPEMPLDRDIVLIARGAAGEIAGVVAERNGESGQPGTFALTLVPDLFDPSKPAGPRDVVFVVDVSGSMGGEPLEQAKAALRLCLRHLREGDRFNVIPFSDGVYPFWPELVPYTQSTLARADAQVNALQTVGGTEMLAPLVNVRELAARSSRELVCVLLTDGQVGNEAEIVEQTLIPGARMRFYTFGIGLAVSDLLLRELARRTGGSVEFIHPGERLDEKVIAQFARATAERVREVSLKFKGIDASELAPSAVPDLVDGEPWVVYGRYESPGVGRAEIRGVRANGEPYFVEVPVELPATGSREGLAALWAAARIRELEEGERALGAQRASAMRKRIVDLAKRHRVSSKHTSFVVVETRKGDRRTSTIAEPRPVLVHAVARQSRAGSSSTGAGTLKASMRGLAPPGPPPAPARCAPPPPPSFMASAVVTPTAIPAPLAPPPPPPAQQGKHRAEPDDDVVGSISAAAPTSADEGRDDGSSPLHSLFARQLANGLWGDDSSDGWTLMATTAALLECHVAGVSMSHAHFGVPLKKALSALLRLTSTLSAQRDLEQRVAAALAAAFLVTSGSRLRARVLEQIRSSAHPLVRALEPDLVTDERARKRLDALLLGS